MHYTPEDYEAERRHTSNQSEGWSMVAWLVCLILVAALVGCDDSEAASVTHLIEQDAYIKKQAVLGHPCTYVVQCNHLLTDCKPQDRKCVGADLTLKRKK